MTAATPIPYQPGQVFPPGAHLEERLEELRMSQAELARRTQVSTKHVCQLVAGEVALTPQMALRLGHVTGMPAALWNELEAQYQTWVAHVEEMARLGGHLPWTNRFPVPELIRRKWMHDAPDGPDRVRALLDFFGVATIEAWEANYGERIAGAHYRQAHGEGKRTETIAAWLRVAELRAREVNCQAFDRSAFTSLVNSAPSWTRAEPSEWWPRLVTSAAAAGVVVVLEPEFPGSTQLNGAAWWPEPTKAVIALSGRRKTADGLWFTFLHEAAHVLRHGKRTSYIDAGDGPPLVDEKLEREADDFAATMLIPNRFDPLLASIGRNKTQSVRDLAERIGVHPGILVGRLQHDGVLPMNIGNGLRQRLDLKHDYWYTPVDA